MVQLYTLFFWFIMLLLYVGKHWCKQVIMFLPLLSFYLWRQIRGEWCGFMCCSAAATLWCYLDLSRFKFCCCHALIPHSSVAHKSHFDTVFYGIWLVFLLKGLCRKLVLCALVSCWYTCCVYAQILFCRTFQVQKQQHKQTRDLSLSNRGRLLNKMLWCLQIQEENLKTLLLGVCVLSSRLKLVNSLL